MSSSTLNKDLNAWKKIHDNFVESTNGFVVGFWVINPASLYSESDSVILNRMNALANLCLRFASADITINFYSLSSKVDLSYQIEKLKSTWEKNKNSNEYSKKAKDIFLHKYEDISSYIKTDARQRIYIMAIRGVNKFRVDQFFLKAQPSFYEASLRMQKATRKEIFLLFNTFFQQPEDNDTFNLTHTKIDFSSLLFSIAHKDKTNLKKIDTKYCKIANIFQISTAPLQYFWLSKLFNINDVLVSYEINSLNEKQRNRFIEGLETDFTNVRQYKSKIKNMEVAYNQQIVQRIISDISKHVQDVKFTKICVMIYATSLKELRQKWLIVKREIEGIGAYISNVNFRQREVFLNMQPFGAEGIIDKDIEIMLTTDAIGTSYPFTETSYIDQDGVYIGNNTNLSPIFLDPCDRIKRASGNMFILGMTGSRKSTLIKIMLLGYFFHNKVEQSVVMDWQNEYTQLARNFGQLVLNFTKSADESKPHINLLEISKANQIVLDDFRKTLKERFQEHIQSTINSIFGLILEHEKQTIPEQVVIEEELMILYKRYKIYGYNYDILEHKNWPTLDSLYYQMRKKVDLYLSTNGDKSNSKDILSTEKFYVYEKLCSSLKKWCKNGMYDGIFNIRTNVPDFICNKNIKLVVFNLFGLKTEGGSTAIQRVMTSNVLRFFDNIMYAHRAQYPRENDANATFINFIVDEFHLIVNENDPSALISFGSKYQTVRKFYCNMCVATPSISTFTNTDNLSILRSTQSIIDNSIFKFIMSMGEDELKQINEKLLSDFNKISEVEVNYLTNFDNIYNAGKFILLSSSKERLHGQIDSGKNIPKEQFNVKVDQITEIAQLWGSPH